MTQETLEQAYRRWDAMNEHAGAKLPSLLEAFQRCIWAYSAITAIAEAVANTPIAAYAHGHRLEGHPALRFVERPNAYPDQNTSTKFRYAYFVEQLLHGAVIRTFGDMQGFQPGTMCVRPRHQFRCEWAFDEHMRQVPVRWILHRSGGSVTYIEGDTCYHDGLYSPFHDFEGLAPLTAALMSVANSRDLGEFANRFFENDGGTGLVFSTDNPAFKQKQAEDYGKAWAALHSGREHAFTARFMAFGLKPHPVGSALDAKLLQVLQTLTKEEIVSGIFKIPMGAIGDSGAGGDIVIGGPSGGTQASAREGFLVNVAMPWAQRYDEEFASDVAWRLGRDGVHLRHDWTANPILERRRLERAKAAVELIDRGVPLNVVIDWLHLEIEKQPHGDDWWIDNDRLPARLVLDAGKSAIKIAIPDPVAPQRKQAQEQYIGAVIALAESRQFAEQVRASEAVRLNGVGKSNAERIRELLSGCTLPVSAGAGGSRFPAPAVS